MPKKLLRVKLGNLSTWISKWIVIWISIACLPGCATILTGVKITKLRRSLVTIIQAVEYGLPGGITERSQNERTFYSGYFPPNGNMRVDASTSKERARCKIMVYKAKRPYAISFRCKVQERGDGTYFDVGQSDELAQKVKKKFMEYLASRPEKTDFIDDFRVF